MNDKQIKPGYKTTEFLLVLVAQITAIAVTFGVLSSAEAEAINEAAPALVLAVATIAGAIAAIINYIKARTELKGGK